MALTHLQLECVQLGATPRRGNLLLHADGAPGPIGPVRRCEDWLSFAVLGIDLRFAR